MIKSTFYLGTDGKLFDHLSAEQMTNLRASGEGLLWVDIEDMTDEDGRFVSDVFPFHSLAVATCISKDIHPPKIDESEDHLFIIVHGINYHVESDVVETTELSIFLGKNYVVTSHDVPMKSVAFVAEQVQKDGHPMRRGADSLVHDLVDTLADDVMLTVNKLNNRLTEVEAEVLKKSTGETLTSIMQLKRSIVALEQIIEPQREIMNRLSRGDYALISEHAQIYYRNIYDIFVSIEILTQSLTTLAESVLNVYFSAVSYRMNDVIKLLSIVATLFLPLTLLASIYGMNFTNMPELHWKYGYFVVWGIMVLVVIFMMSIFKRMRWL